MKAERALVVIGGGEHAQVVIDDAIGGRTWRVRGYVAPERSARLEDLLAVRWLGDDAAYLAATQPARRKDWVVIGVGETRVEGLRRSLADQLASAGCRFGAVVHPNAIVARSAEVAPGAAILAGAMVNPGARIGEHCIVNTGAVVEHGVVLGRFAAVAPGVTLGGGVQIGENSFVGLGACVRDHVKIGRDARVAMGAVVVADVPDGALVMGVPARVRNDREIAHG